MITASGIQGKSSACTKEREKLRQPIGKRATGINRNIEDYKSGPSRMYLWLHSNKDNE